MNAAAVIQLLSPHRKKRSHCPRRAHIRHAVGSSAASTSRLQAQEKVPLKPYEVREPKGFLNLVGPPQKR